MSDRHVEPNGTDIDPLEIQKLASYLKSTGVLTGVRRENSIQTKMTYRPGDLLDYVIMSALTIAIARFVYGEASLLAQTVQVSVVFLLVPLFALRFGFSAPSELNLSNLFWYFADGVWIICRTHIENCRRSWLRQVTAFILVNLLLRSQLVADMLVGSLSLAGPIGGQEMQRLMFLSYTAIPHDPDAMAEAVAAGLTSGLFYLSFGATTTLRIASFCHHIFKRELVFDFLSKTSWSKSLNFTGNHPSVLLNQVLALAHAFVTGIWTHILTVAPWALTTSIWQTSILIFYTNLATLYCNGGAIADDAMDSIGKPRQTCEAAPATTMAFVGFLSAVLCCMHFCNDCRNVNDFHDNHNNLWFIKDHYLSHKLKFAFNYLHGPHHDALPVGIIAVADNGPLEGFMRHAFFGHPDTFVNPIFSFWLFTKTIIMDMFGHQYVPGVFPFSSKVVEYGVHHVEHHFLSLYPLGNGFESKSKKCPLTSNEVERQVFGYDEKNERWSWFKKKVSEIEGREACT